MHILAQVPPPPPAPTGGGLTLDTIFWFSVLAIFLVTILSAFLRRLAKDKALKLLDDYHVALFVEKRPTIWGDLVVLSQGVELLFDEPFTTRRKLVKSSALIYDDEFAPVVAITRSVHGLTDQEKQDRKRQIRKTFNPGVLRRFRRWLGNLMNTLRDAITKTVGLIIGRITRTSPTGAAIGTQANDINQLTGTVVNLAANAYEPLLERYIGKPVILEIFVPGLPEPVELPGYLVDYTSRFIAVFNVDHTPIETHEIKLDKSSGTVTVNGLLITVSDEHTTLTCVGRDPVVLRHICCLTDQQPTELGMALIQGTSVTLGPIRDATTLTIEVTRQIDIVAPRTRARIRYGSVVRNPEGSHQWLDIGPALERVEKLRTNLRDNIMQLTRRDEP